jgi:hypothetical protein
VVIKIDLSHIRASLPMVLQMYDWRHFVPDGFAWNDAKLERSDPLNRGFLSLLVVKDNLQLEMIGTAFIVDANRNHALAVSAAHTFEGIRNIVNPNPLRHSSTPAEFLPPPPE